VRRCAVYPAIAAQTDQPALGMHGRRPAHTNRGCPGGGVAWPTVRHGGRIDDARFEVAYDRTC
jgi:hypothetical protein